MQNYELAFIISSNLDNEGVTNTVNRFSELVKSVDGEVTSIDVWGRRPLAYAINRQREGVYVLSYVKFDPSALVTFERDMKLVEEIIRYMVIKLDN